MTITGRITADAQVHTLKDERQVVNFSIAVNDSYRNKEGERIEHTTYFDCSFWRTPNIVKILTKGTVVELTGRASVRAWADKNGTPRAGLNFHTSDIKPLAWGKRAETLQATNQPINNHIAETVVEDDLPF